MSSSKLPAENGIESDSAEQDWVESILKTHLDTEVDNMDFVVSSKLKASRNRAVAQDDISTSGNSSSFTWLPVPALAGSVAVIAFALLIGQQWMSNEPIEPATNQMTLSPVGAVEDLHMLSGNDDIDFFQSMELLEWMDSQSG